MQRHIHQQHSKNPPRFTCLECGKRFTTRYDLKLHLETLCGEVKPAYICVFCGGRFTRDTNRQAHMRKVHGLGYDEEDVNLLLHLQHLSEEKECKDEWMFVESRPIEVGEHNICPCGTTHIKAYYFLENRLNGNRTFVGSTCIETIDPRVGQVIGYFQHILTHPIQGSYVGEMCGLHMFTVASNTKLVDGAEKIVHHLHPQVFKTLDGQWYVLVKHPKPETLIQGQSCALRLKAKYVQGQLTFTVV